MNVLWDDIMRTGAVVRTNEIHTMSTTFRPKQFDTKL